MLTNSEVILQANELAENETKSGLICPECGGGQSKERSFNITRTETGVVFNCHRNSCGYSGGASLRALGSARMAAPPTPRPKQLPPVLQHLRAWEIGILRDKHGFTDKEIGLGEIRLESRTGRLYLPIISAYGAQIGYNLRSLDGTKPKSLVTLDRPDIPLASFYGAGKQHVPMILVEDQLSAIKVASAIPEVNSCALMGTSLDPFKATTIQKNLFPRPVIIALDADAISKAVDHFRRYRALFQGGVQLLELERDLKDTPQQDIIDMIKGMLDAGK